MAEMAPLRQMKSEFSEFPVAEPSGSAEASKM